MIKGIFKTQKEKMLSEKIDYAIFICELLNNYCKNSKIVDSSNF